MSAVIRLTTHSDSRRSMLKLSLSCLGDFLYEWSNSALLTLATFTLTGAMPFWCCGEPIGPAGEEENTALLAISAFSSREVAVLP